MRELNARLTWGFLDYVQANEVQKKILPQRVVKRFGENLSERTFAIWGLAFKPNTDDMREAPSLVLIRDLLARGATLRSFDPVAADQAHRELGEHPRHRICSQAMAALVDADALIIVTEWKQFRSPDFSEMKALMRQAIIFDGRNIYEPTAVRAEGFEYIGIGRP